MQTYFISMKVKTIIFDLGGVLLTIDQPEAVRRFKALGLEDAERRLDPYTQHGIFGDLESGTISDEDFRRELSRLVGRELSWQECQYAWLGYAKDVPRRNLELLRKLHGEGYQLVLLSNTNPFMMAWARSEAFDGEGHSLDYYLDRIYCSYQVKTMKPDRRFFETVIQSEGILPGETLFIDDGLRNIAAAAALGLHTFCPKNGEDWTEDLRKIL